MDSPDISKLAAPRFVEMTRKLKERGARSASSACKNMALKVTVQKWHEVVERISRKVAVEYVWRGCWVWEGW